MADTARRRARGIVPDNPKQTTATRFNPQIAGLAAAARAMTLFAPGLAQAAACRMNANVLHDITGNKSRATIGRDSITEHYGRTWAEVGVGAQFPLGKATYLFGDVKYERSLSNNSNDVFRGNDRAREGYSGRVGLRYTW